MVKSGESSPKNGSGLVGFSRHGEQLVLIHHEGFELWMWWLNGLNSWDIHQLGETWPWENGRYGECQHSAKWREWWWSRGFGAGLVSGKPLWKYLISRRTYIFTWEISWYRHSGAVHPSKLRYHFGDIQGIFSCHWGTSTLDIGFEKDMPGEDHEEPTFLL